MSVIASFNFVRRKTFFLSVITYVTHVTHLHLLTLGVLLLDSSNYASLMSISAAKPTSTPKRSEVQLFIRCLLKFNRVAESIGTPAEWNLVRDNPQSRDGIVREGGQRGEIVARVKLEIVARQCRRRLARIQQTRRDDENPKSTVR